MGSRDHTFSDLKPGQQATLFPSLGYFDLKKNRWRAQVHGRVYDGARVPIGTRILLRGLKRAMQATPEDVASETFQKRIDGFLTTPGRRRRIVLQIHNHYYRLRRRTRRNGAFYGTLSLPTEAVKSCLHEHSLGLSGSSPAMPMHLVVASNDHRASVQSDVYLTPPVGISIISDIDDTIKLTDATSRREMLANTFLRPFAAVDGMATLYQLWQQQGCHFHYVSSSPWELYESLAELCTAVQFPAGSMHLRYFRVRDEMFKRFRPVRRNSKVGIIAGILKRLPQRRFVLIGDSGEKDPEIYRFLAKRFPERIAAILIRNLAAKPLSDKRLQKLKALDSNVQVTVFETPEQIAGIVPLVISNQ
ncbi:MAG: App1 family protein [Planctomycetales bacterium]|nr:App1 family protein [Planctomycetales bacterium]